MFSFAGTLLIGYLAGAGLITNSSILARGLKKAVGSAVRGDMRQARSYAFAAVTAPALVSVASVAALVFECVGCATEIAGPAFNGMSDESGAFGIKS